VNVVTMNVMIFDNANQDDECHDLRQRESWRWMSWSSTTRTKEH